jgi:NADPH:quinone reductase-like Zn-dependent oxidoreductase
VLCAWQLALLLGRASACGANARLTLHPFGPPTPRPQDPKVIRRCKRRVFELFDSGQLQAWVDVGHGFRGVDQIADCVDYMLTGGHVGKVVIPL